MKLNFTKMLQAGALLCFVLASCKKSDVVSKTTSQSQEDLNKTTSMIGAMANESDFEVSEALSDKITDCPIVTFNPATKVYPYIKTADYGSGCTDDQGITRSGKRFYTVYADQNTAAAGQTVSIATYSNYVIDGVTITGTVKISVAQAAMPGPLVLKVVATKDLADAMGNSSSFISNAMRTLIAGGGTKTTDDDVYQIQENLRGSQVSGDSTMIVWTSMTDPNNLVIKPATCHYRAQGDLQISLKEGGNAITKEVLDYGNGDCDNAATLSVNGGTPQPVTLPFYFFDGDL